MSGRRTERCVAGLALAVGAVAPWLLFEAPAAWKLATAAALLAALYAGFERAGWLASVSRIVRVSWLADGRWMLSASGGGSAECELRPGSRVSSQAVWLQLRSPLLRRNFYMLLTRGDTPEDDLRRLIVRLRFDAPRARTDAD